MGPAWELESISSVGASGHKTPPGACDSRPDLVGLQVRCYFVPAGCANSSLNAFLKIFPTLVLGKSVLK